ncbi:MAG: Crp/Fnr family transcriptional regulator [Anaerolineae bacterium]|nr:Crp/Fnr family transcriptional regulator [Anaerolineae bacterium]
MTQPGGPTTSLRSFLPELVYFEDLSDDELDRLARVSVRRHYDAGQIIFLEDEPATGLWIIEKGRIKIYKISPDGVEHILHILGPRDTFNDIATFDGGNNPADAAALSRTEVDVIPAEVLIDLIAENSDFALKAVRVLAKRVRSLVGQIESLALYSVTVRLSRFLLDQIEDPSLSGPGVTRTAIAAHLATTPQTISNALRELEHAGVIEFDRHRIWIIDEPKLRSIAML